MEANQIFSEKIVKAYMPVLYNSYEIWSVTIIKCVRNIIHWYIYLHNILVEITYTVLFSGIRPKLYLIQTVSFVSGCSKCIHII